MAWNTHKSDLRELETAGVPVIDTVWVSAGDTIELDAVLRDRGWERGFIKPAVGCSAECTCRFDRGGVEAAARHLESLLETSEVLLQPYLDRVESTGEVSAIVIDGQVTHCVRKLPRSGDYRVQDDYGATDERFESDGALLDLTQAAVACAGHEVLYARADFLQDQVGRWVLTELEVVEPSMFFRHAPDAAERLAEALLGRL